MLFMRCPNHLARSRPDVQRLFRAFELTHEHGVLPVAGGYMDQTAAGMHAFGILKAERVAICKENEERAERERKRQEFMAGRQGLRRG